MTEGGSGTYIKWPALFSAAALAVSVGVSWGVQAATTVTRVEVEEIVGARPLHKDAVRRTELEMFRSANADLTSKLDTRLQDLTKAINRLDRSLAALEERTKRKR